MFRKDIYPLHIDTLPYVPRDVLLQFSQESATIQFWLTGLAQNSSIQAEPSQKLKPEPNLTELPNCKPSLNNLTSWFRLELRRCQSILFGTCPLLAYNLFSFSIHFSKVMWNHLFYTRFQFYALDHA